MKHIIFFLSLVISVPIIAQTTDAYAAFVAKANFLKESKSNGGIYKRSDGNNGTKYVMATMDEPLKITKIVKENDKVASFEMDYLGCTGVKAVPNNDKTPIFWSLYCGDDRFMVLYKEYLVFLTKDPSKNQDFDIRGWYQIGGFSIKEKTEFLLAQDKKTYVPPFTLEDVKADMKASFDAVKQEQNAAEANKKAKEAELYAKNGLKGKTISKMEIVTQIGTQIGYGTEFIIGVKTTLADGTVIKTKNIGGEGYIEDYNIKLNGNYTQEYNGNYKFGTANAPTNDVITVEVTSKHHTNVKAVSDKIVATNDKDILLNFNGEGMYTNHGKNGQDLRIEIKNVTHAVSNKTLVEYRITDASGKKYFVRLNPDVTLKVTAKGGDNKAASNAKENYNGGNGGNVTVYIDPAVGDNYRLEIENSGGKPGNSKEAFNKVYPGTDGKVTKTVQKIN